LINSKPIECGALTRQERAVASLIGTGLTNRAIAEQLKISIDTAKRHSSRVKQKLRLDSTTALAFLSLIPASISITDLHFLPPGVSKTERRVLLLLCGGSTSKHIARAMPMSARTVDKHRESLLRKCEARSVRELVAWIASEYVKGGIAESAAKP
jgi:DNA-binding NarL/FixJ family response regulator